MDRSNGTARIRGSRSALSRRVAVPAEPRLVSPRTGAKRDSRRGAEEERTRRAYPSRGETARTQRLRNLGSSDRDPATACLATLARHPHGHFEETSFLGVRPRADLCEQPDVVAKCEAKEAELQGSESSSARAQCRSRATLAVLVNRDASLRPDGGRTERHPLHSRAIRSASSRARRFSTPR